MPPLINQVKQVARDSRLRWRWLYVCTRVWPAYKNQKIYAR